MSAIDLTELAAAHIRQLLLDKGWSQNELSKRTKLGPAHINRLLAGDTAIGLDTLSKLAKALDIPAWQLLAPALKVSKAVQAEKGSGRMIPDLGLVAAGTAIDPKADPDAWVEVMNLPDDGDYVSLTVKGDSMVDAAILDGDQVIIRCQPTAESGEDVVCVLDGKLTLKQFFIIGGVFWLVSHNKDCPDIEIVDLEDSRILGVLVRVIRVPRVNRRRRKPKL